MSRQRSHATPPDDDYTEVPIYWFALLDKAVESGDPATAAEARRQLDRLGIRVRYRRPHRRREVRRASC
jgi:hypothetical protein